MYYQKDELGSPIRLLDSAGSVRADYVYDEFGNMPERKADTEIQPFRFTGYQYDKISETYFAQAREYSCDTGRFISKDFISGFSRVPVTLNRYAYLSLIHIFRAVLARKDTFMIRERLGKELLYFDGGMGTLLQERGLEPGELPETWNLTHAEEIREIHRSYIEAGSDIILTNTFGANALKFHDDSCSLEEIVKSAVGHVRAAAEAAGAERPVYTALDVGPTGKLLKPMGDLDFETAYEAFKAVSYTHLDVYKRQG